MKIVSLLPSATEIICELGLSESLVGVTHECNYPLSVLDRPKVTRTRIPPSLTSNEIDRWVRENSLPQQPALYSLDVEILAQLQPDLIVTQSLCNVCAVATNEVEAATCMLPNRPRVLNLEPHSLQDVFQSIQLVADAAFEPEKGNATRQRLNNRLHAIKFLLQLRSVPVVDVVVLEWLDPLFSIGHWTPELVEVAGGREMLGKANERSREISWEEVLAADPDVLLIACCGYSRERALADMPLLRQRHRYRQLRAVRNGRVYVIDGDAYFSRPGPRLVEAAEMLVKLLHPDAMQVASSTSDA